MCIRLPVRSRRKPARSPPEAGAFPPEASASEPLKLGCPGWQAVVNAAKPSANTSSTERIAAPFALVLRANTPRTRRSMAFLSVVNAMPRVKI